jgi:polyphosphate kinase
MDRNMFRRIEIMFPVSAKRLKQRLIADLDTYLSDTTQAWNLSASGEYLPMATDEDAICAQTKLLEQLAESY